MLVMVNVSLAPYAIKVASSYLILFEGLAKFG